MPPISPNVTLHGAEPGRLELGLYALTLAMATGPLDRLIQEKVATDPQRAAVWALVYLGFGISILRRPRLLGEALADAWPLFGLPLLAILSASWSANPHQTIVGALEMTAAAIFGTVIGRRLPEGRLLTMVVAVLGVLTVADWWMIAAGPGAFDINGNAVGLFSHKNMHGQTMAMACLAALATLVWGRHKLPALLGLLLAAPLLALSGSTTSWIVTAAAGTIIMSFGFHRLSPPTRLATAMLAVAVLCTTALIWLAQPIDLEQDFLRATGKDPTLTGRTVLWDLARHYIRQAPVLGCGFNGFWTKDITSDSAFVDGVMGDDLPHFHNGYLEMAVELGWTGTLIEVATILAFLRPIRRLIQFGDPAAAAFAGALLTVVAVGNLSEVVLFVRHGFHLILIGALWSRAGLLSQVADASTGGTVTGNSMTSLGRPARPLARSQGFRRNPSGEER